MNVIPLSVAVSHCRWPGCQVEPTSTAIPLCERHYAYIGQKFMGDHADVVIDDLMLRTTSPERIEERRRRNAEHKAKRAAALEEQSQVYYVRIGDHIKIGYSINLVQRLSSLRVDRDCVLATEPGGRQREAERHKQFAPERVGRKENFNPSRRLLDHIESIRQQHGDPKFTTYPNVGSVA